MGQFIPSNLLPNMQAACTFASPGIFNWFAPSYPMPATFSSVVTRVQLSVSRNNPPYPLVIVSTKYKTLTPP